MLFNTYVDDLSTALNKINVMLDAGLMQLFLIIYIMQMIYVYYLQVCMG